MNILQEFVDFLNNEEIKWIEDYAKSNGAGLKEMSSADAAKAVARLVIHNYIGLDRTYAITQEQNRRWGELQRKAKELGLVA